MIRVIPIIQQKRRKKKQETKQTHNLLVSIVLFVRQSYLFYVILVNVESKSTISCVFLSMSTMSTSYFEFELYEYDIKISMNAYKYQKL